MNKETNEERNKSINIQTHKCINAQTCVYVCFCAFVCLCFYVFMLLCFRCLVVIKDVEVGHRLVVGSQFGTRDRVGELSGRQTGSRSRHHFLAK